jgi:hypothetical protein
LGSSALGRRTAGADRKQAEVDRQVAESERQLEDPPVEDEHDRR